MILSLYPLPFRFHPASWIPALYHSVPDYPRCLLSDPPGMFPAPLLFLPSPPAGLYLRLQPVLPLSDLHTVFLPLLHHSQNRPDFPDQARESRAPRNAPDTAPSKQHFLPAPLSLLHPVPLSHCLLGHKKSALLRFPMLFFYLQDFSGNKIHIPIWHCRSPLQSVNPHASETEHQSWIQVFHSWKQHLLQSFAVYSLHHFWSLFFPHFSAHQPVHPPVLLQLPAHPLRKALRLHQQTLSVFLHFRSLVSFPVLHPRSDHPMKPSLS